MNLSGEINRLYHPNECACILLETADHAVPSFAVYFRAEYKLTPAVIYPEEIDLFHAGIYGPEHIIPAIIVRCKSCWNKNFRSRFENTNKHSITIRTSCSI